MLASDLNNPEFVNPQNPDSLMYVEFYMHEPIDKWGSEEESQKQGKRVVKKLPMQPYVRIMRPGDKETILEVAVREEHKIRWPERWMYFQMSEGLVDGGENIPGYKIEDWPEFDDKPDQLRELKFMRFHTVEQIAGASDSQVQRMGLAGPGLRERARVALRQKLTGEVKEQLDAKDKEVADLKEQMQKMQEQMQALLNPEKRLGRPPKEANG